MAGATFQVDRTGARLLGVCAGLSRTTGINVTILRAGVVVGTIMGLGAAGIAAYLIAAWAGRVEQP